MHKIGVDEGPRGSSYRLWDLRRGKAGLERCRVAEELVRNHRSLSGIHVRNLRNWDGCVHDFHIWLHRRYICTLVLGCFGDVKLEYLLQKQGGGYLQYCRSYLQFVPAVFGEFK